MELVVEVEVLQEDCWAAVASPATPSPLQTADAVPRWSANWSSLDPWKEEGGDPFVAVYDALVSW